MKNILAILLTILLLQGGEVFARSSGRSYSSGASSSCGRSYSSGGASSGVGRSFSSGASHAYSSGGSSTPKSYSSGGSSPKSYSPGGNSSKPYSPGESSGRSYSPSGNGSKSYSTSPASKPNSFGGGSFASDTTPHASSSRSFGRSYSAGGSNSFVGKSATDPKGNFNSALTSAGQGEDSRIAYEKHYTTPAGTTKPYTPADQSKAERIRSVDENRYRNYDYRAQVYYGNYPPTHYNDYWSPFLMGYLLSSSVHSTDRAAWVYNHRDSIDDARYHDLVARDAGLAAQLRQMELQHVQRDPNYVLPTMVNDPDLMYDKGFRRFRSQAWSLGGVRLFLDVGCGFRAWSGYVVVLYPGVVDESKECLWPDGL